MEYDIEKYLKAKAAKEELLDKLEKIEAIIKNEEELMSSTFNEEFEDEVIDLGNGTFWAKKIGTSIDTEGMVLDVQTELFDKFGDTGFEMYKIALEEAQTIRESWNRTKFVNSLKKLAKEKALDVSGIISAAELENSTKTIKTKIIEGK